MKIGISACLLGHLCTYKGFHNLVENLDRLNDSIEFISICPEVMGGLTTPRDPSEIVSRSPLIVRSANGKDVTKEYIQGAKRALEIIKSHDIHVVLLKHRSPSCGCDGIYDGTFTHTVIQGQGVCAQLMNENGIKVFHEKQINEFLKYIGKEEEYGTYFKD